MKTAILATLAVAASADFSLPREHYEKEFYDHMTKYQVEIKDGAEFARRLEIFATNMEAINKHNEDKTQTYQLGQNKFTHLTFDEFLDAVKIGGTRVPNLRRKAAPFLHSAPSDVKSLPTTVDWVSAGAVTPVKDQGNCGSCWSFSSTGALEGAYQIKNGNLQSFSEQQLVSCDHTDSGCNGGWMDDAFTFVKDNGGITTETQYPYTSGTTGKTGTCVSTGYSVVTGSAPASFTDVTTGSVNALMSAVAQQPVSIAIQANQIAFQSYKSGVLTGKCGQRLDHGVLAVGYGTDSASGLDYWKVKNSWGSSWGEGGYIRILRSDDDLCGVLDAASYPNY
jgi:KDEL-tailed cysteine endopeptidase